MKVSAFTFIRNGVLLGYPWVEATLSLIDYVDELCFLECYSDDSTLFWMRQIQKRYQEKVRIEQMEWSAITPTGTSIGTTQTYALRLCRADYALLFQADEVWWPQSIKMFRKLLEEATANSYSFDFKHCGENYQKNLPAHDAAYTRAIRCVKNIPTIRAEHDGWTMCGDIHPSIYVPLPRPIMHVGYENFLPTMRKRINHAKLYPDLADYQRSAKESQDILLSGDIPPHYLLKEPAYPIPEILLPLVGKLEYEVRQELLF